MYVNHRNSLYKTYLLLPVTATTNVRVKERTTGSLFSLSVCTYVRTCMCVCSFTSNKPEHSPSLNTPWTTKAIWEPYRFTTRYTCITRTSMPSLVLGFICHYPHQGPRTLDTYSGRHDVDFKEVSVMFCSWQVSYELHNIYSAVLQQRVTFRYMENGVIYVRTSSSSIGELILTRIL